jgi:hypothetical protein
MSKKDNKTVKHTSVIAEWLQKLSTGSEVEDFLNTIKDPFGDPQFSFYKDKDDVLYTASSGYNDDLKEFLFDILGKEEMAKPERNIFYPAGDDCSVFDEKNIDCGKLEEYHEKYKKQYLDGCNIITFHENNYGGNTTKAFLFYVVSFDKRVMYTFGYEESDEGDECGLSHRMTTNLDTLEVIWKSPKLI